MTYAAFIRTSWRLAAVLLLLGLCAGCQSMGPSAGTAASPPQGAMRDFVLQRMTDSVASLQRNDLAATEESLDEAISGVESVFGADAAAAKARSVWYEEGCKVFKGEPYERMMAYYYRGLVYLMRSDLENARACFRGGILQDAFAEEMQNRCDVALLYFLDYWLSLQLKDSEATVAAWNEVQRLRPDFEKPAPNHNVLIVVETGTAPRKLADGVGHGEMVYRRGKGFVETKAQVRLDGGPAARLYAMEDIFMQAATRGGRAVDRILQGKVQFRNAWADGQQVLSSAGQTAMLMAPLARANSTEFMNVGIGLSVVGATAGLIAMNAKPHADTRYWPNLPDAVHVLTIALPDGIHTLSFEFLDSTGTAVSDLTRTKNVMVGSGRSDTIWLRSRP